MPELDKPVGKYNYFRELRQTPKDGNCSQPDSVLACLEMGIIDLIEHAHSYIRDAMKRNGYKPPESTPTRKLVPHSLMGAS